MNILLWLLQVLLGLLFLFAGGSKLIIPFEMLMQNAPPGQVVFSPWFIKFIGVCEFLGGLGLLLPGLFKTQQFLTPLAALGLAIIMVGAVAVSVIGGGVVMGMGPVVILLLLLFVAYGRWRVAPHGPRLK
jgi:hypothetical protein